jgi:hypothetical protein
MMEAVMVSETVKIIANVPKEIADQAAEIAAMRKVSRSRLVTECLLAMIEKRNNDLLAEGYKEMAVEHEKFAGLAENTYKEVVPRW